MIWFIIGAAAVVLIAALRNRKGKDYWEGPTSWNNLQEEADEQAD